MFKNFINEIKSICLGLYEPTTWLATWSIAKTLLVRRGKQAFVKENEKRHPGKGNLQNLGDRQINFFQLMKTYFLYKQHFYTQNQDEIGRKLSSSYAKP